MWTIDGYPLSGYTLMRPDGSASDWNFSRMWDAIAIRDAINRGEIRPKAS